MAEFRLSRIAIARRSRLSRWCCTGGRARTGQRRPRRRSRLTLRVCENRRMGSVRLTATLVPRGPAAAVVLDGEQVAALGEGAKRFPVVATVNGHVWRTT